MKNNNFYIMWYIYNACNYSCNYCYDSVYTPSDFLPTKNQISAVVNELSKLNKNIIIFLSGGEITLWEDLKFLIDLLYHTENIKEIHITSNGSNPLKLIDLLEFSNKLRINISAHLKYFNVKNISTYQQFNNFHLSIIYDPKYINKIIKILNINILNTSVKLIRDNALYGKIINYTSTDLIIYKMLCDRLNFNDRSSRYIPQKSKYCTTGNFIRIDFNGDIYTSDYKCKKLFNIYNEPENTLKISKKNFFLCTNNFCYGYNNCDRFIFKSNDLNEISKYINN